MYVLAQRYDKSRLLSWAAEVDAGFSAAVFADMASTLHRFADDELPVEAGAAAPLREFFSAWATELRSPRS